ncbi:hypothetical protein QTJ16_006394 [Diplocarpon rosae]|uniref:protein-serine/threonine phosphatase n=1 Tax=Diplocarpon rosae TaxID=946125 RepID=A0AAD9SWY0_9HELO|nr:hypothetical protein QTJ16_006394 [Diplocarpon rosae]
MTTFQPKSILKKAPSSAPLTTDPYKKISDRNLEVALYHATLLQARKDLELQILLSTESLIDFPLSPSPASHPSSSDAFSFKSHLAPFTPSDYDALIEERNINSRCGILGIGGKASDFKVVRREELEKWCGIECKKRAMWVRVQLSERPAWERTGEAGPGIELLDEPEADILDCMEKLDLSAGGEREKDIMDLARERGDTKMRMGSVKGMVDLNVTEKDTSGGTAVPPRLGKEDLSDSLEHLSLEGYTSRFEEQRAKMAGVVKES